MLLCLEYQALKRRNRKMDKNGVISINSVTQKFGQLVALNNINMDMTEIESETVE